MNRRGFVQITATALIPILLNAFPKKRRRDDYSIRVISNRTFGHRLRRAHSTPSGKSSTTDIVIVGGGIAGISAACTLQNEHFKLFEASDRLGGSSASGHWKDTEFALGAHYELAYPKNFGKEVIDLLLRLRIMDFNKKNGLYEFTEKKYVIKSSEMEQCFTSAGVEEDILGETNELVDFYAILEEYAEQMVLPTRKISEMHHHLNGINFKQFLRSKMPLSKELENRISYQMLDDWGGKIDEVSALAGIHYYTCRPYNLQDVELFSPPNGNAYFIEKMVGQLPNPESLITNTIVKSIQEYDDRVETEILHLDGTVETIISNTLIYAGQKHALKYILKEGPKLFEENDYAPWVVINFICKEGLTFEKWQNDVLTDDLKFLGFVNSQKQHSRSEEYDVLTAYFCFAENERKLLVQIEEKPEKFIASCLDLMEDTTHAEIARFVVHANIHLMGHAMPIPKPGYLSFQSVPAISNRIVCAGVDTGRLPLFFEACDSGIEAANWVLNKDKITV